MKAFQVILLAGALSALSTTMSAEDLKLNLRSQSKVDVDPKVKTERVMWNSKKTALIICDMWDDHWCKSASRRVGEMAPALNDTVKAARAKGIFIIHAPSSVVNFYKDTSQRKLARKAPFAKAPPPRPCSRSSLCRASRVCVPPSGRGDSPAADLWLRWGPEGIQKYDCETVG